MRLDRAIKRLLQAAGMLPPMVLSTRLTIWNSQNRHSQLKYNKSIYFVYLWRTAHLLTCVVFDELNELVECKHLNQLEWDQYLSLAKMQWHCKIRPFSIIKTVLKVYNYIQKPAIYLQSNYVQLKTVCFLSLISLLISNEWHLSPDIRISPVIELNFSQ